MKYKVIELNETKEKGIVLIEEKQYVWGWRLNLVLLESDKYVAISSEDFNIIGEIDIDD